jgi:LuxR family maltose regulon positive regulatory protein
MAEQYELPLSQAHVLIAQGAPSAALAALEPWRQEAEARGWADQRLRAMVLQALALHLDGKKEEAAQVLGEALALAEPGGFIRLFVDEGEPMRSLLLDYRCLTEKQSRDGVQPQSGYVDRLLAAFAVTQPLLVPQSKTLADVGAGISNPKPEIVEPLTGRELEILRLIAQGFTNKQIGARLFLSLNTVKGHNRVIFDKLQVERRTEAIARARELGLL